ncbi:hypothetical protein [Arthrobacter sp. zg-Y877]|uniref:hypothetical protein n=1 Tax=Arthrobacter sp. zg-Y877 TaxID=3049074 RepID=UPI0025A394AD|nr:hypothetical protein [Arthrobacter sp. zg-Y877]MDM7990158.1 hypothetical protein [Arthrobacter sp. zg-Y877]
MAIGSAFGILYLLAVIGVSVLVVWALVLVIIFLRLRIAQLRGVPGETGEPL